MRLAGSSEEDIVGAKKSPFWPGLEAIAHTLAYDAACLGNAQPPTARLAKITRPTLVATGSAPTWGGEGRRWLEEALTQEGPTSALVRAKALGAVSRLASEQGDYVR